MILSKFDFSGLTDGQIRVQLDHSTGAKQAALMAELNLRNVEHLVGVGFDMPPVILDQMRKSVEVNGFDYDAVLVAA